MIRTVTFEKTTYAPIPDKFEAGTPAIAAGIGLGAAIDYMNSIDFEAAAALRARTSRIRDASRLADIPGVRIIGTPENERRSYLSLSKMFIRTTSARSSTRKASPFAPATTVPSR